MTNPIRKFFRREVKIGLIGLLSLFMIIYGINFLKGINLFQPTHYFYVRFDHILGLTKSSTVFADGFRIGLVRDIHYDYQRPGNILVEVQLDRETRIPKGSYCEISTEMLGGVNMNIILPREASEFYVQGDTIEGRSRPKMTDVLENEMMPQVQNLLPKIDSILTQINAILANQDIPATMHAMRTTSENLSATTANLKSFTANDMPRLTQSVNQITNNLGTFTAKLNDLQLEETMQRVNTTLADVSQMTSKLGSRDNTIGLLLNDDSLYINLNRTAHHSSTLMQDLQTNPKRYVHFSLFGKKSK